MSLLSDFRAELAQTCTIALVSSHGAWGPTYGTATSYACYAKLKIKNIKDKDGNEAVSSCQIYLDGHPSVEYDSKLTYATATPPIKLIQREWDEKGGAYATVIYT